MLGMKTNQSPYNFNDRTMKKIFFIIAILSLGFNPLFAQVGIGTPTPNANAELDVVSTTQGVLFPRLDDTQAGVLAGNLTATDNGMIIYNTTDECLQIFVAPNFECIVVRSGTEVGDAGVVKVNLRDGANQTARVASGFDGGAQNTAHPGYISIPPNVVTQFDFEVNELVLSGFPTTNWPENSPDGPGERVVGTNNAGTNIFRPNTSFTGGETGDAWLENNTFGQIHFWRVIIYVDASGHDQADEGNLQLTIRNPQSAFSTSTTRFNPTEPGIYELSFILSTIADDFSLPSDLITGGFGNGYVFEVVSSNAAIGEIWVDSITRISIFAD